MNQPTEQIKTDKRQTIDWLIENFPTAFFKKSRDIKPLKIGIFDDLIDFYERLDSPPFSKKALREALNYYSRSPAYLSCQKTDTARIDLFGNEVDVVTLEQAKYAHHRHQERYHLKKVTPSDKLVNS
jgi:ProP effector